MIRDPAELGDVLGVWAHPDDESYLTAGLMAGAVDAGARVVCVTATRGEAGIQDAARWPPERLAEVRTQEMGEALAALGVRELRWLDCPDGACSSIDHEEGASRIAELIAEVSPQTLVTFGPDEFTRHPDHIAVSEWTTDGFERAAPPGACLYYAAETPEQVDELVRYAADVNGWAPETPPSTPLEEMAIDLDLDDALLDRKLAALRAHRSQTEAFFAGFEQAVLRRILRPERFRLVARR